MMNDHLTSNFQPPVSGPSRLVSTLLCEDVLSDAEGNLTIYRVFRRVSAGRFPAMMRRLYVVTAWLGEGTVSQRVLILSADKTDVLYDCAGQIVLNGEQQVPFVNRFQWLVWPAPGVYWLRVLSGQQPLLDDIPIRVDGAVDSDRSSTGESA
jgi:hypothetical protein